MGGTGQEVSGPVDWWAGLEVGGARMRTLGCIQGLFPMPQSPNLGHVLPQMCTELCFTEALVPVKLQFGIAVGANYVHLRTSHQLPEST